GRWFAGSRPPGRPAPAASSLFPRVPRARGWVCVFPCPDDDPPPVRPGLAGVLPRAAAVASVAAYSAYAAHAAAAPVSNVIYKLLYVNYIFHHGGYILRVGGQAPGSGAAHTLSTAHGAGGPGGAGPACIAMAAGRLGAPLDPRRRRVVKTRRGRGGDILSTHKATAAGQPERQAPPAHTLPPLPYEYDALEPYIDERTMRLHHDIHHRSYVEGLNRAEAALARARR